MLLWTRGLVFNLGYVFYFLVALLSMVTWQGVSTVVAMGVSLI